MQPFTYEILITHLNKNLLLPQCNTVFILEHPNQSMNLAILFKITLPTNHKN